MERVNAKTRTKYVLKNAGPFLNLDFLDIMLKTSVKKKKNLILAKKI